MARERVPEITQRGLNVRFVGVLTDRIAGPATLPDPDPESINACFELQPELNEKDVDLSTEIPMPKDDCDSGEGESDGEVGNGAGGGTTNRRAMAIVRTIATVRAMATVRAAAGALELA